MFVALLFIASVTLFACHRANLLNPHVVKCAGPKWLFVPGGHINFDTNQARLIGDWITMHQGGWNVGSIADFDPSKTQLMADNYVIEINGDIMLFDYYEHEADMTNDPDSFIVIKRTLSPDDQDFWKALISRIKTSHN